jgi:hypothetical protein
MGFVIATVFTVALLFNSCESKDQSELLGIDSKVFPQGVAKNFLNFITTNTRKIRVS